MNDPPTDTRSKKSTESIVPANQSGLSTQTTELANRGLRDLEMLDTKSTDPHSMNQQPGEALLEWVKRMKAADPNVKFSVKRQGVDVDLRVPLSNDIAPSDPVEELARQKLEEATEYLPSKNESAIILLILLFEDQIDYTIPERKDDLIDFIVDLSSRSLEDVLDILRPGIGGPGEGYSLPYWDASAWTPLEVANHLEEDVHCALLEYDASYCSAKSP